MNGGPLPMSNGLTRLQTRFLGEPERSTKLLAHDGPFDAAARRSTPGWCPSRPTSSTGTTRCAWRSKARAAFSPDALTGMEANLRFAGPETMETKIFGRLTAWQNWIFQRPERRRREGRADGVRHAGAPGVRLQRT